MLVEDTGMYIVFYSHQEAEVLKLQLKPNIHGKIENGITSGSLIFLSDLINYV